MRIVPAILSDNLDDFKNMIDISKGFTDFVQIDLMDGIFVPSKSISRDDLEGLKTPLDMEAHLMVEKPDEYIAAMKSIGAKRIIFHFEADPDPAKVISEIKKVNVEAGLAVNPGTSIGEFESLVPQVYSVLFLSVNPGFYGSPFIPDVLDEIRRFRAQHPSIVIGIDGGISLDNIKDVKETGVNYACVGSRILMQPDPQASYKDFLRKIDG